MSQTRYLRVGKGSWKKGRTIFDPALRKVYFHLALGLAFCQTTIIHRSRKETTLAISVCNVTLRLSHPITSSTLFKRTLEYSNGGFFRNVGGDQADDLLALPAVFLGFPGFQPRPCAYHHVGKGSLDPLRSLQRYNPADADILPYLSQPRS